MAKEHKHKTRAPRQGRWRIWLGLALVVVAGLVVLQWPTKPGQGRSFGQVGGETRTVLDAFQFADPRIQLAYAGAKKYGDVFDQVYCYCHCDEAPFHHKSLKSCFTELHGSQ